MAGRPDWDGLGGRRGSLDSNKGQKKPYISPFKCSIDPLKISPNMADGRYTSPTAGLSPVRLPQDYPKMLEELQKENLGLKVRLYLLDRQLSQASRTDDNKLAMPFDIDLLKAKDMMIDEALKTANLNEKKYVEVQSKLEQLEDSSSAKELELQKRLKEKDVELQNAIKMKNEQIEEIKNNLEELQSYLASREESRHKLKYVIQALVQKMRRCSLCNGESNEQSLVKSLVESSPEKTSQNKQSEFMEKLVDDKFKGVVKGDHSSHSGEELEGITVRSKSFVEKEHSCSFQKELEDIRAHSKDLEKALVETEKQLAEKVSEVADHLTVIESKEQVLNEMKSQLHSLSKSHENTLVQSEEKELLVKNLTKHLGEMEQLFHIKDLELQDAVERRESLERRVSVRRNLGADFEKEKHPTLMDASTQIASDDQLIHPSTTTTEVCDSKSEIEVPEQRISSLETQLQDAINQKSAILSEYIVLQQHVEKLARFMEKLITECSRLSISDDGLITPAFLSEASDCLDRTLCVSQTLVQDISSVKQTDLTQLATASFDQANSIFESTRFSMFNKFPVSKVGDQKEPEEEHVAKGSAINSAFTGTTCAENFSHGNRRRRRRWSSSIHDKLPINLECGDFSEICAIETSETASGDESSSLIDVPTPPLSQISVTVPKQRTCWGTFETCPREDYVNRLRDISSKCQRDGGPAKPSHLSSDSDIWSEPDRELSVQRVGIPLEKPLPSPVLKRGSRARVNEGSTPISSEASTRGEGSVKRKRNFGHSGHDLPGASVVQDPVTHLGGKCEAEEKIQWLEMKLEECEAQLSDYNKQFEIEKETIDSLVGEKFSLTQQILDIEKENKSLKERFDQITRDMQSKVEKDLQRNTSDYHAVNDSLKRLQETFDKATDTDELSPTLSPDQLEIERIRKEEESEIFALKTRVCDLRQQLRKTVWKKDLFLVTKTVLIQRLNAEIKEKEELIKKLSLEAEGNNAVTEKLALRAEESEAIVHKLSADVAESGAAVRKLTADLQESHAKIETLAADIKTKNAEAEELATELQDRHDELQQLTAEIHVRDAEIQKLCRKMEENDIRIENLTLKLRKDNEVITTLKDEVMERKNTITKLTGEIENNEAVVRTVTCELEEKSKQIDALTAEVTVKNAEIQNLNAEISTNHDSIQKMSGDAGMHRGTIQKLISACEKKDEEIRALNAEIVMRNAEVQILSSEVEARETAIKTLKRLVNDHEGKVTVLQEQVNVKIEKEKLLEEEKRDLFNRISKYTIETSDIKAQLLELGKQVRDRELRQQDMETQLVDLKSELQMKNEELLRLKEEYVKIKSYSDECEEQVEGLKHTLSSSLREQETYFQQQLEDKDNTITDLSNDKEAAQTQIANLVDNISSLNAKQVEIQGKATQLFQEISEKESVIQNLSHDNESLQIATEQYEAQMKELHLNLANYASQLNAVQNDLKSKFAHINKLEQTLNEKDKLLQQQTADLNEKSDSVYQLENMLQEYARRADYQSSCADNLEGELKKSKELIAQSKLDGDRKGELIEKYEAEMKHDKGVIESLRSCYEAVLREMRDFHAEHLPKEEKPTMEKECQVMDSQDVKDSASQTVPFEKQDDFKIKLISVEKENTSLKAQLTHNNATLQKLIDEKQNSHVEIKQLREQLNSLDEGEIKMKIKELVDQVLYNESQVDAEKQKLQFQINQHEAYSREMEAALSKYKTELYGVQNDLKQKCLLIEKLQKRIEKKSNLSIKLELCKDTDNTETVSPSNTASDNSPKRSDQQLLNAKEIDDCILDLKTKLANSFKMIGKLKSDLNSRQTLIEMLKSDLNTKAERHNKLEQELKLQFEIVDQQKRKRSKKAEQVTFLKSEIEEKCKMIKQLKTNQVEQANLIEKLMQQIGERSNECKEGKDELSVNVRLQAQQAETINHLEKRVSELISEINRLKKHSDASDLDKECLKNSFEKPEGMSCGDVHQDMLLALINRKWWMQKSILQLQAKLFKDTPLPLQRHLIFLEHIASLYSKIEPPSFKRGKDTTMTNEPMAYQLPLDAERHFLYMLQADYDFLKSLRHLLKYFVIPITKHLSSAPLGDLKDILTIPEKTDGTLHERDGDHGKDTRDPKSSAKLEHSPVSMEKNVQSEPVSPRSNYSSPDLGIESDPNQDPAIHEPARRGSVIGRSKDSLNSQPFPTGGEEAWASSSSIHAIAALKDFELLRKEVEECLVGLKAIMSRTNEGLKSLGKYASPRKLLECGTLKGISDSCKSVEMCLSQIEMLVNKFWYSPYPFQGEKNNYGMMVQENLELKQTLEKLIAQQKDSEMALMEHKMKSDTKAKHISKQLVETKKMLRQAKANLEGKFGNR